MKVLLGADHQGYQLKEKLKTWLLGRGIEVEDFGANTFDQEDDYPDFIAPAAEAVAADPEHIKGIILGNTGQGEAIAANKVKGARAAVYYGGPLEIIRLSREHNDANVLSLGAAFLTEKSAKEAVKLWLETPFSNGARHKRRLAKIAKMETGEY